MADNQETNNGRRRFLTLATCDAGSVTALDVATPFVTSFFPLEEAKTADVAVEVDVNGIKADQMLTVGWQGKPTWLVNRTDQQLKDLKSLDGSVTNPNSEVDQQPEYVKNEHRSIKPNLLVATGTYTRLGRSPTYHPDVAPADLGADWKGGFFYPCHDSKFDMAGHVYGGVPTPTNLVVPSYKYLDDTTALVGED